MIRVLPAVRRALDAGDPVVALESSVFAQGLPIPHNADAARRMLGAVERVGALPAITAVAAGEPALGLEPAELERFLRGTNVRKVSARDLAACMVEKADGATTVAAAIALAGPAGAQVFATGGIGGVHRRESASAPLDESADLLELARSPMVVVCAGAKAILDLPATWERLDTLGVPVVGFGTSDFPGFYTTGTGIPLLTRADTPAEVAAIAVAHFGLGRTQAVLVVQPPPPGSALEPEIVEKAVASALADAARTGVRGAAVTPHLLAAVSRETAGKSLAVNLDLLEANARLAGEIAVALGGAKRPNRFGR